MRASVLAGYFLSDVNLPRECSLTDLCGCLEYCLYDQNVLREYFLIESGFQIDDDFAEWSDGLCRQRPLD